MTTTFSPRETMLRVNEKIFPVWALFDEELDSSPQLLLYLIIWLSAFLGWNPSQAALARLSKMSLRAAQDNLGRLEQRGYIVSRREGTRKCYDLALSPHVLAEFLRQGVELLAADARADASALASSGSKKTRTSRAKNTQNLRVIHAESAPAFKIKERKEINTPLSPLTCGQPAGAVGSSPAQRHMVRGDLSSDFEKLWEAWPVKKGRAPARHLYRQLAHQGRLPSPDALLSKVATLKAQDAHWQNGYVKELGNWLKAEGWNDEPFLRPAPSSSSSTIAAMPAPLSDSRQEIQDTPVMPDKPSAPMRRETVLAIAAKPFCPWKRDEINAMLELADEFYQNKKGIGKNRISGQPTAHSGAAGTGVFGHADFRGTETAGADALHRLPTVLPLPVRPEGQSALFSSFHAAFSGPGSDFRNPARAPAGGFTHA